MSKKISIIGGKGDWEATPPTGASDHDLYHVLNDFYEGGGVLDLAGGDFEVTESLTPGMTVIVKMGTIFVPNSSWSKNSWEPKFYRIISDSDEEAIAIANNASGQIRTDLVCQSVDKVTEPNDDASNVCPIVVFQGTPGSGAPAVPDDMEVLAEIEVADGTSSITNAEITDRRRQIYARPSMLNSGFVTVADAATITLDCENGLNNKFYTVVEGNRNLAITNMPIGHIILVCVEQGTGGSFAPTFTGSPKWSPDGDAPDFSTDEGVIDSFTFVKLPDGSIMGVPAGIGAQ